MLKGTKRKASEALPEDPEERKCKRPVSERKERNKHLEFITVKTTLRSFCKETFYTEGLKDALETVLIDHNKVVTEAYVLANIHVVRLCSEGKPVCPLDNKFFNRCLSAVSQGVQRKQAIKELEFRTSVELYKSWRPAGYVETDSSYLPDGYFQNASTQMATNTKNSISAAFYRRFKRYLKARYGLDGKETYHKLKHIMSPTSYDVPDEIVTQYRNKIPDECSGTLSKLDKHPHLAMHFQYEFLKFFEEAQEEAIATNNLRRLRQLRTFSLLPTKQGFTCSHVKIDSNSLGGLLRRARYPLLPPSGPDFRAAAPDVWDYFFDTKRFGSRFREFHGEIETDGKAVSIRFHRDKEGIAEPRQMHVTDFDEVWGLDPGRTDFFVASSTAGEVQKYSTKQYKEEVKHKYSVDKIKVWQRHDTELHQQMPTKKTASLDKWREYVEAMLPRLDALITFNMVRRVRDLRFTRYTLAQRKLHHICKELTQRAGKRTLIGFGDWSNRDQAGIIKKSPAGPVKVLERRLRQYATVVSMDEFKTSKLHNDCHRPLEHQHSLKRCRDGVTRTVRVHSALFCRNKSCHGVTVNRDVNASRNILMLTLEVLRGQSRTLAFSRGIT